MSAQPTPHIGTLILGRRVGESIQIGDDITVTFVEFHGHSQIRLSIKAPKHVKVVRTELLTPKEKAL